MQKQKKLGLALGAGGWRGLAHIGVIKELLKNNIQIDYIAGSSAGALVGGFYAACGDIEQVEKIFRENMSYRRLLKTFSDPRLKWGLFEGNKVELLFAKYLQNKKIEETKIPFCALACDLLTCQVIELKKGLLSRAIHASVAMPFFLQPVEINDRKLVDGAVAVPIPAKTSKQMGAEVVVAINLNKNVFPLPENHDLSAFAMARKTTQIMGHHLAEYSQASADLVLQPDIKEGKKSTNPFVGFINREDVIDDGAQVVRENIDQIKKMLFE